MSGVLRRRLLYPSTKAAFWHPAQLHLRHNSTKTDNDTIALGAPATDDSREPVEAVLQRILEPEHAKSIGLTSDGTQSPSLALVPLTIIYLPPPDWHTPVRLASRCAKNQQQSEQGDKAIDGAEGDQAGGSSAGSVGAAGPQVDGSTAGMFAWLRQMFSKADKGNAGTSPASGQTSEILDRLKQRGTRDTRDLADSVSAFLKDSVLHQAVLTGRKRIEAIKALPQDDDWVTWASKALNQMTGYERIQTLKEKVETCGVDFNQARHDLQAAKEGHGKMIHQRISSQREINSLLQRKHLWDETDVARFTSLYRDEHQAEILERTAGKELKEAEELVDRRYGELVGAIRERYHEEQIWSDKIRRASTYGTWAAIFEPRKRRKIVAGVDEKLTAAIADQNSRIADVQQGVEQRLASHEGAINEIGQHLGALASVLAAMDQRQATEMAVISSQLLNSTHEPDEPENTETELDMYNNIKPSYTRKEAHRLVLGTATVASIVTALVTYYFAG
ncbi:hypothetical protein DL89DRAFT_270562 [Linderina pennispora]|uniref:Sensitive to high expression protein 9, mitochondrial n=1 Tax=Linderina pennispora TaxID=61395 RepID=A0A1Y1VX18_9FUNG|nr:uncharacterized protein DL89DRAFT_270562 [Linderina pennispora]ORX65839.1 hypothetical protein DL89DRAFT_270562 [Linderina pennispora]